MKVNIDLSERMIVVVSRHENMEPNLKGVKKTVQDYLKSEMGMYALEMWHKSSQVLADDPMLRFRYEIQHVFEIFDPFQRLGNPFLKERVGKLVRSVEI